MLFPNINDNVTEVTMSPEFATIKVEFEGGYEQTRERHSRNRATLQVKYFLSSADKDKLLEHYNYARGSTAFVWTHPESGKNYTVRYTAAPKVPSKGKSYGWHDITIQLKEV